VRFLQFALPLLLDAQQDAANNQSNAAAGHQHHAGDAHWTLPTGFRRRRAVVSEQADADVKNGAVVNV
jgi:hypothetical protein